MWVMFEGLALDVGDVRGISLHVDDVRGISLTYG
jgi:hypothetical protein